MKFYPLATLSPKVPIICCAGISKQYLVPGWRLGWIILHNRYNALSEVKSGIISLAQQIMGPSSLIQGALPDILHNVPNSFFENICNLLQTNSDMIFSRLIRVPGLKPLRPSGAMYMMVKFDPEMYGNESDFVESLIREESLYTFSGSLFNAPNWLRLLLTFPEETTKEACDRIEVFCQRRRQIYHWSK
jgi:tyrosine aminotransferase